MRMKLDENFGKDAQQIFTAAGHDVETAYSQGLSGAPDQDIYKTCCSEQRCLVTMDLDFSDPVRFPARQCGGIIILRPPRRMTASIMEILINQCLNGLQELPMDKSLWIVEPSRIRIRQVDED